VVSMEAGISREHKKKERTKSNNSRGKKKECRGQRRPSLVKFWKPLPGKCKELVGNDRKDRMQLVQGSCSH